jgi:hypothetical protein
MKNPLIYDEDITDEWFLDSIREEIPQKDCYTEKDLLTVAKIFFNYFRVGKFNYTGINAFAEHHYGALLQKAINLPANATERIAVKKKKNFFRKFFERIVIEKKMKAFREFSIEYFHYDPKEQKFIDEGQQQA